MTNLSRFSLHTYCISHNIVRNSSIILSARAPLAGRLGVDRYRDVEMFVNVIDTAGHAIGSGRAILF